jgi:FixJ family two-component response regulator
MCESMIDRGPLVYVVDDDDALRDSLVWLLESAGYRVEAYASAEAFLAGHTPAAGACLVLDVRLPGMSGLQLQQVLIQRGSTLPVIFITGHGSEQMQVEATVAGARYVLQKPFLDERLLAVIEIAVTQAAGS